MQVTYASLICNARRPYLVLERMCVCKLNCFVLHKNNLHHMTHSDRLITEGLISRTQHRYKLTKAGRLAPAFKCHCSPSQTQQHQLTMESCQIHDSHLCCLYTAHHCCTLSICATGQMQQQALARGPASQTAKSRHCQHRYAESVKLKEVG